MGNEIFMKKDIEPVEIKFGLIYPNSYKIGMSSYTMRLLYHIINSQDAITCERVFLPDHVRYPFSLSGNPLEPLKSLENEILLRDFDVLGFSIHYENDYRNVLWMLENASLLDKENPGLKEDPILKRPLILGGGPVITSNPLPFAGFLDVCFIGDAEPNISPFLDTFLSYKQGILNQQEFLHEISNMDGLYIPKLKNHPVKRAILHDLDESLTPINQLMTDDMDVKGTFSQNYFIEINRGCPYQCKFCLSSFHNSPFRNKSYETLIREIDAFADLHLNNRISFIGSCVSAHPRFSDICNYVLNKGLRFALPSIRIEHLNEEVISLIEKAGIKTITIAPETGSETLRQQIGKKISNEKLLDTIKRIKDSKIRNIKFYFLLGLPNETDKDIEQIVIFLNDIDNLGFGKKSLRVNVNPFIPKLSTPFQVETIHLLKENVQQLRQSFLTLERKLRNRASIKLNFKNVKALIKNAKLQALISLGDEEIRKLLYSYYRFGANYGALRRAEKLTGVSIEEYLVKINNGYVPWILNENRKE